MMLTRMLPGSADPAHDPDFLTDADIVIELETPEQQRTPIGTPPELTPRRVGFEIVPDGWVPSHFVDLRGGLLFVPQGTDLANLDEWPADARARVPFRLYRAGPVTFWWDGENMHRVVAWDWLKAAAENADERIGFERVPAGWIASGFVDWNCVPLCVPLGTDLVNFPGPPESSLIPLRIYRIGEEHFWCDGVRVFHVLPAVGF